MYLIFFISSLMTSLPHFLSLEQVEFFKSNGYLIIPNFLKTEEADQLKAAIHKLIDNFDTNEHRHIFGCDENQGSSQKQGNDYFLNSWNKIAYFFEEKAFDHQKQLVVDKHKSINKIGHALHDQHELFRQVTYDKRIQDIARDLKFVSPAICQSMYIFKQPRIGGGVTPHQDSTFLWTEPKNKVLGFWIAFEKCTQENGCLWFAPESHKDGLLQGRRFLLSHDKTAANRLYFEGPPPELPKSAFIPGEVDVGSLVLIDGFVVHESGENNSDKSREIYTWHIVETKDEETGANLTWSENNWIQPGPAGIAEFSQLY